MPVTDRGEVVAVLVPDEPRPRTPLRRAEELVRGQLLRAFDELTRTENLDPARLLQRGQVPVSRDDRVGASSERGCQGHVVIGIAADRLVQGRGVDPRGMSAVEVQEGKVVESIAACSGRCTSITSRQSPCATSPATMTLVSNTSLTR